jgi:protein SCO1/2
MRPAYSILLKAVIFALLIVIGFAVGTRVRQSGWFDNPTPTPTADASEAPDVPDFTLTNQDGRAMSLSELQGKTTIFVFAFTNCPDICPLSLADFKRVKKALGAEGDKVNYLMMSVDGARDTPEVMKRYLGLYDPAFIGLTGSDFQMRAVADFFGATFEAQKPNPETGSYSVSHSGFSYVIDAYGRWRKTYAFQTPPEKIAEDLRGILAEPPPQTFESKYAQSTRQPRVINMTNPGPMKSFTLTTHTGLPFMSHDLAGKPSIVFFGMSECLDADPCNVLNQVLALKKALGKDADKLQFVMISVDGNIDTPERLSAFVAKTDADWLALTGEPKVTLPLAFSHGVHVEPRQGNPTRYVPHPVYAMALDREGRWVLSLPVKLSAERSAEAIRSLLASR